MFHTDELNSVGVYAAELFLLGLPITVVIDDYLPMDVDSPSKTFYAKVPDDGAMWGLLFEKLAAKFYGNYEVIDGGESSEGVEVMTGAPYKDYLHESTKNSSSKKATFWTDLLATATNKSSIVGNTFDGNDDDGNDVGIAYGHAYSIKRALTVTDASGTDHKLVECRNPWGEETFKGDWSDSSSLWTDDLFS